MGNRAVITTRKDLKDIGVYLHWNGGRDSVEGFLTYCKIKGYRPPEYDNYGWAYLCTTIGNFFGQSGLSLGVDVANKLDCDNWDTRISGRMHTFSFGYLSKGYCLTLFSFVKFFCSAETENGLPWPG